MLTLKSSPLELRGIVNKTTKKDKVFYTLNVESADGSPYALYCPDVSAFPAGLKKGDMITVTFDVNYYMNIERLIVTKVEVVK